MSLWSTRHFTDGSFCVHCSTFTDKSQIQWIRSSHTMDISLFRTGKVNHILCMAFIYFPQIIKGSSVKIILMSSMDQGNKNYICIFLKTYKINQTDTQDQRGCKCFYLINIILHWVLWTFFYTSRKTYETSKQRIGNTGCWNIPCMAKK